MQLNSDLHFKILEAALDAVISIDGAGRIVAWNPAAEKIFGHARNAAIGQDMAQLIFPRDPACQPADSLNIFLTSGEKEVVRQVVELTGLHQSGATFPVELYILPMDTNDGSAAFTIFARDITDRKRAESDLQTLKERVNVIADNAPVMIAQLDRNCRYTFVNDRYAERFGRAPADLIGCHARDILGEEAYERAVPYVDAALSGSFVHYDFEIKDQLQSRLVYEVRYAPVREENGTVKGLIAAVSDITTRKITEEAYRESEARIANLMNSTAEGIYGVGLDGICNFANQACASLLGFNSADDLVGQNMHQLIHHHHKDGSVYALEDCQIYQSFKTGEQVHVEDEVLWRRDGTSFPAEYWSYPLLQDDRLIGSVVTFVDISERKKSEEERELLMREVNHRANNLLTVVQTIARQTSRNSQPKDFTENLINRLQSLSASQDAIIRGNWKSVDLSHLVTSQLAHLGLESEGRLRVSGPKISVKPEAAQGIGMAIHELATNAVKYGALSNSFGYVSVAWSLAADQSTGEGRTFDISWQEHDGPPVTPPTRTGFGNTVIERMASHAVGGHVSLSYDVGGVKWRLTAPVDRVMRSRPTGAKTSLTPSKTSQLTPRSDHA